MFLCWTGTLNFCLSEIARVLLPGGLFVHHDTVQMEDDSTLASGIGGAFASRLNEPYIQDYVESVDLNSVFAEVGIPGWPYKSIPRATARCYRKAE